MRCLPLDLQGGDWTGEDSRELATLLRAGAELPVNADTVTHLVHAWLVTVLAARRRGDQRHDGL